MKRCLLISHTDLDGYASQYVSYKHFIENGFKIDFLNLDYNNVEETLMSDKINYSDYKSIVITDLNLNYETALFLDENVYKNDENNLLLIDHHDCDKRNLDFPWYEVNREESATLLAFYKFFRETDKINKIFESFANNVSIYDNWRLNEDIFHKMIFISEVVNSVNLIFTKREFLFKFFDKIINEDWLRCSIHEIELHYLELLTNLSEEKLPSKQKLIYSEFDNFKEICKNPHFSLFENYKFIVLEINSVNFQYLSSKYLNEIDNDVIFLNFDSKKESCAVRSKNGKAIKVAKLFNGGGHPNASGFFTNGIAKEKIIVQLFLSDKED